MSGFNGSVATPVSSAAAAKQRDALGVYSKSEVDAKTAISNITFGSADTNVGERTGFKRGVVAQLRVVINSINSGWNNNINIGLPIGSRPNAQIAGTRQLVAAANGSTQVYANLTSGGTMNIWSSAALTTDICFTFVYLIGG